jgi:hypothetical protein
LWFFPTVFFVLVELVQTAAKTQPVMTAYHPTASGTAPLGFFLFKKLPDARLFDEFNVFNHAHMIFGAVPIIEGLKSSTGEISTLKAKPNQSVADQIAVLFHKGAVLPARQTTGTVCLAKPLVFQVIFHREVAYTNSTIHSARSYQYFFHQFDLKLQITSKAFYQ